MKAGLTFVDRTAETKSNIKRCHLISCGMPVDESSAAKKMKAGGEDNSPGVNNTATRPDIIPKHDKKTCPDKANDTAPC